MYAVGKITGWTCFFLAHKSIISYNHGNVAEK